MSVFGLVVRRDEEIENFIFCDYFIFDVFILYLDGQVVFDICVCWKFSEVCLYGKMKMDEF